MKQNFLKYHQLLPQIKKGVILPVYIFLGEENYLKEEIIQIIKQYILGSEFSTEFNFNHLYGHQTDVNKVIEIASTLPVFSNKRMLIVDEFNKLKKLEKLNQYLNDPVKTTCLILNSPENNLPSGLVVPQKNCAVAIFYTLWKNELYRWIITKVKEYNKNISSNAVEKLIEYCDNSLTEINKEIEKLVLYVGDKNEIKLDDVLNLTGDIKKFSVFALTDAICSKDFKNSLKIFRRMIDMGIDIMKLFGVINNSFHLIWKIQYLKNKNYSERDIINKLEINPTRYRKLLPGVRNYSIKSLTKIVLILTEYDKKLKTSRSVPKNILIEDMLYKICFS